MNCEIGMKEEREYIREIRDLLLMITKFDISTFKEQFLKRRLSYAMNIARIEDLGEYYNYLIENPSAVYKLIDILAINVSYFFRNENVFKFLKDYLINECWEMKDAIKIWSMGCASGEEPYTIGMILNEIGILNDRIKVKIYASDLDNEALEKAKKSVYNKEQIMKVPKNYLKYFIPLLDSGYMIEDGIRRCVIFRKENLLSKKKFYGFFNMILCRNLLIFLDKRWQRRIFQLIDEAIAIGGILVLGISENLHKDYEEKWRVISGKYRIYMKIN